jgi:hypothetical protein
VTGVAGVKKTLTLDGRERIEYLDVTRCNRCFVGVLFFDDVSVFLAGRKTGKETGKTGSKEAESDGRGERYTAGWL